MLYQSDDTSWLIKVSFVLSASLSSCFMIRIWSADASTQRQKSVEKDVLVYHLAHVLRCCFWLLGAEIIHSFISIQPEPHSSSLETGWGRDMHLTAADHRCRNIHLCIFTHGSFIEQPLYVFPDAIYGNDSGSPPAGNQSSGRWVVFDLWCCLRLFFLQNLHTKIKYLLKILIIKFEWSR